MKDYLVIQFSWAGLYLKKNIVDQKRADRDKFCNKTQNRKGFLPKSQLCFCHFLPFFFAIFY